MNIKEKTLKYLQGGLELTLLMRAGINAFTNSGREALYSFIPTLLTLPLALFYVAQEPPETLSTLPTATLCVALTLQSMMAIATYLAGIWAFARWAGRVENFARFVSAYNWVSVIMLAVMAPFMIFDAMDWAGDETVRVLLIFLRLYGTVITALILARSLSLHWTMAGALAIFELFVFETYFDITHRLLGLPLPG